MMDKRTSLRQVSFTGQGFAVVHHIFSVCNRTVPPFIATLRATNRLTSKVHPPVATPLLADDDTPPAFDNYSESDAGSSMTEVPDTEGPLIGAIPSGSASSHSADMDGIDSTITVRPTSFWPTGTAPTFLVDPIDPNSFAPARIQRAKRLVFGSVTERDVQVATFSPSKSE